jgi:hypothetical protein
MGLLTYLFIVSAIWAGEPTTWVAYRLHPDSTWVIDVNVAAGTVRCQHADHPDDAFEVDYDGNAHDGSYPGIFPVINGVSLSGQFFYGQGPFISPPFTQDASSLTVETDYFQPEFSSPVDILRIRLEGPDYRELNQAAGDAPLFTEAAIYYESDGLHIDLYGLYYLMPSIADTRVVMTSAGKTIEHHVTPATERTLEYYPDVTHVAVSDSVFGDFYFDTYCQWLQIDIKEQGSPPGAAFELFEFDFDHTFKDRGQREVLTQIVFPDTASIE